MNKKLLIAIILILFSATFLSLFSFYKYQNQSEYDPQSDDLDSGIVTFLSEEHKEVMVEIVQTPITRAKGLMFVESMPENEGMLFVFEKDSSSGFWMKNTLIPLDIVYIDSERMIVDIQKNAQPCKDDPCPTYPSEAKYLYVVEVNGGWTENNNVRIGDKVLIPLLHAIQ